MRLIFYPRDETAKKERMCSVAGEMLAAYSPPAYYFGWRRGGGVGGGGGGGGGIRRRAARPEPARPCLVLASPAAPQQAPRPKKKVVFADDRGLSLTQVRMMTEPSNLPPAWSSQFISILTEDNWDSGEERWEVTFAQPASDYIEFKRRLDRDNVSLENVFVKEREGVGIGTVKVRNLAFEKEVLIRATFDDWNSHEDVQCAYVNNSLASTSVTVLYDTFSFRIPLHNVTNSLEFCVYYRSNGIEFWDNNSGRNYRLVRKGADPLGCLPKSEPPRIARSERSEVPSRRPDYPDWGTTPYW